MLREPCDHGRYEEHGVPYDPGLWCSPKDLTDTEALTRLLTVECGKWVKCSRCDGTGFGDVRAAHGCDGTDESCARTCPVPEPTQCVDCQGHGGLPCPSCGGSGRTARMPIIPTSLRPGGPPGYWVPASKLKGGESE